MRTPSLVPSLARLLTVGAMLAMASAAEYDEQSDDGTDIVISATRTASEAGVATQVVHEVTPEDTRLMGEYSKPMDMLERLPGVFSIGGLGGGVSGNPVLELRGTGNDGSRLMVDGVPLNRPWAGSGQFAFTALPMSATTSGIGVVKGVQPIYGSNAVGGVIDLHSVRPSIEHEQMLRLEGGSFEQFLGLGQATGAIDEHWGYALGISAYDTDGVSALTGDPSGDPAGHEDDGMTRLDGNARIEYEDDWGMLYASTLYIDHEYEYDAFGAPDSRNEQNRLETRRYGIGGRFALGQGMALQSDLAYTDYQGTRSSGSPATEAESSGSDLWFALRANHQPSDSLTLSVGLDHLVSGAEFVSTDFPPPDFSPVAVDTDDELDTTGIWTRGVYGDERWEVDATVRGEFHSDADDVLTWRLGGAVQVWQQRTRLLASVGTGFRAPSVWEIKDPVYGNDDLDAQTSLAYEAGHETRFAPGCVLSNIAFRTEFEDRISYDPVTFVTINDDGDSWAQGVESMLEWAAVDNDYALSLSHTYLDAEDSQGDRPLVKPEHTVSFASTWFWQERTVWATLTVDWVDEYLVYGFPEPDTISDRTLVGLNGGWQITDSYRLYGRIRNVFDVAYAPNAGYSGEPMNAVLGVQADF